MAKAYVIGVALAATSALLNGCGQSGGGGGGGGTPEPPPGKGGDVECSAEFKRGHCTKCFQAGDGKISCKSCQAPYTLSANAVSDDLWCTFSCADFKSSEQPGLDTNGDAQAHNGVEWPSVCIDESSSHFFTIGDWGGMCGFGSANDCQAGVKAEQCVSMYGDAEPGKPCPMANRAPGQYNKEIDYRAQSLVSARMLDVTKDLIQKNTPAHFIVNVGDNFYPGGIDVHCGKGSGSDVAEGLKQFTQMWKAMYPDELSKLEWWSVLGNHDYGGTCFIKGWDQQIFYTWHDPSKTWVLPGQYWKRTVQYKTFKVDFFFIDGNIVDSNLDPHHSICASKANPYLHCEQDIYPGSGDSCAVGGGPTSQEECHDWFHTLWNKQYDWLTTGVRSSTAEWQIVVNHYPPSWSVGTGEKFIKWSHWLEENGIDLYISGHTHEQRVYYGDFGHRGNMGKTPWVITGGGGGVSATEMSSSSGEDDSFGFMDMEISLNNIKITAYSHGGVDSRIIIRNQTTTIPVERIPPTAKRDTVRKSIGSHRLGNATAVKAWTVAAVQVV